MKTIACVLVVLGLAGASFATQIGYSNDFSSLSQVTTRAPLGAPYLDDPDMPSYVSANVDAGGTGYFMADIGNGSMGNDGVTGAPIDATNGQITLKWRYDYTGTDTPPTGDSIGLWLRVYSGTQNPDNTWTFVARAGYFFDAKVNQGWSEQTKPINAPEDLYGGVPLDPTNIYKFRFDVVFWDAKYTPAKMSFDQLTVTPEPASLALLALGGLVLIRRRR